MKKIIDLKGLFIKQNIPNITLSQQTILNNINDNKLYIISKTYKRLLQVLFYDEISIKQIVHVNSNKKLENIGFFFYSIIDNCSIIKPNKLISGLEIKLANVFKKEII